MKLSAALRKRDGSPSEFTQDQKNFIRLVLGKEYDRIVWSLGFGNGKSVALAAAINGYCIRYPRALVYYGRKHIKHFYDMNYQNFFRVVPQSLWKYKIYGGRYADEIVYPNGSKILFTGFADPSAKLGGEPALVAIEEVSEIDLEMWNYLEGRLRCPAVPAEMLKMVGVGNPRGHYPLYRKFVHGEGVEETDRKRYIWYKGDPYANKDNLPERYYEKMWASFPQELRERFILGSDDTHAGQIYPEFDTKKHVHHFEWKPSWRAFVGLDYGKVDPTAVAFLGFDPNTGDVYLYREYYRSRLLIPEHAKNLIQLAEDVGFPLLSSDTVRVADSNIMDKDPNFGRSVQEYFADHGLYFDPAKKRGALIPGIEKIQNLLAPRNGGRPLLHIHPSCQHTIEEFWMYEWKTPRGPVDSLRFKEEPVDDYNHMMDAMRYAINAMPLVEPAKSPEKWKGVWGQLENPDGEDEDTPRAIIWNEDNFNLIRKYLKPGPRHPLLGPSPNEEEH